VRPDIRRLTVAAAFLSLVVVAGCTEDPDKPTLGEATKQLIADGDKLLTSRELAAMGSVIATERADQDSEVGCLKGQVQRFYRAQGDLTGPPYVHSPGNAAGLMASWLGLRRYDTIVDDLDLRDENLGAAVLQNPMTGITFLITVRNGQKPHIMIVGKTSCYARGG
jgi:outer membrane murein-binding lipoprotein Lpp